MLPEHLTAALNLTSFPGILEHDTGSADSGKPPARRSLKGIGACLSGSDMSFWIRRAGLRVAD